MNKGVFLFVILTLLLAVLSTLSSNVQRPLSYAAQPIRGPSPKNSSFVSLYDNVTTHEGDLIINGTQTFVIENCTYVQEGSIYVDDYGKLEIRDSILVIVETYGYEFQLRVEKQARLATTNSVIEPSTAISINCMDDSNTCISNSSLIETTIGSFANAFVSITNSSLQEVCLTDNSQMTILESTVAFTVDLRFYGEGSVSLEGIRPGYFDSWNLQNQTGIGCNLTLTDTYVGKWSLQFDQRIRATVSNSSIERIVYNIEQTTTTLDGIHPGLLSLLVVNNLTLTNTFVGHWVIQTYDSSVNIVDTQAYIIPSGSSDISVVNSDQIILHSAWYWIGILNFTESSFTPFAGYVHSNFYICGDAKANTTIWTGQGWFASNATRNYSIVAEDRNGSLMENVVLTLFDRTNTTIWNGFTDSSGIANFNLTFTDINYTEVLRLEAAKGNLSATANVSFLSDTPIILALGLHEVATIDVAPAKTVVGQGFSLPVNVTIANQGTFTETCNVILYANTTGVKTKTSYNLANGTSKILSFIWDTTGFELGNYTISACATPVPGETYVEDNNFTGGWIVVAGQGDLTGGTPNAFDFVPDGQVNIVDVAVVAKCFGQKAPPAPANCDVSGPTIGVPDGKIDITDVATVAKHFGQHYP